MSLTLRMLISEVLELLEKVEGEGRGMVGGTSSDSLVATDSLSVAVERRRGGEERRRGEEERRGGRRRGRRKEERQEMCLGVATCMYVAVRST